MAKSAPKPRMNSRAARREEPAGVSVRKSTKIDSTTTETEHIPKSIATLQTKTSDPSTNPAVPYHIQRQNNGISKKKPKLKHLTHAQKSRRQAGLEKALAVQDQLSTKRKDAKQRFKTVQARRADWEDVNGTVEEESRKKIKGPGRGGAEEADEADAVGEGIEAFEGDTEIKVLDGVLVPSFAAGEKMEVRIGGGGELSALPSTGRVGLQRPGAQQRSAVEVT